MIPFFNENNKYIYIQNIIFYVPSRLSGGIDYTQYDSEEY